MALNYIPIRNLSYNIKNNVKAGKLTQIKVISLNIKNINSNTKNIFLLNKTLTPGSLFSKSFGLKIAKNRHK